MKFDSIPQFIAHLATIEVAVDNAARRAMKQAAEIVEAEAKVVLSGEYQAAIGPFAAWKRLDEDTKEQRVEDGFTPDAPVVRQNALGGGLAGEHKRGDGRGRRPYDLSGQFVGYHAGAAGHRTH